MHPFDEKITRVSEENAQKRNELMLDLADEIVVGYASEGGKLEKLLTKVEKQVTYFSEKVVISSRFKTSTKLKSK